MERIELISRLTELVGDSDKRLTVANFMTNRGEIGDIFGSAEELGVPGVDEIMTSYRIELIQSGGNPSSGRVGYIRGHLGELLKAVESYNP